MKIFQPTFLLVLSLIVAVCAAQDEPNCDAICNERVQQAVQPVQEEKVRAEEWGHGVRRELEETQNKMRGVEEEANQLRTQVADRDSWVRDRDSWIQERDQIIADLRVNVENAKKEAQGSKREIEQIKHDSHTEIDELRTKAESSSRSLGRVQFALDEAADQIKEMESARISVNVKGIQEDVRSYWKNLLGWWTGLVMPDKRKKEEDL